MNKSTLEIENRINSAKSINELRDILSDLPKVPFTVRIDQLCHERGMNFSKLQIATGITKSLFYAFVAGTRSPKKVHIIKMGMALELSVEELNELLKLTKHKELYAKNKDDAILIFAIKNKLTQEQLYELLSQENCSLDLFE